MPIAHDFTYVKPKSMDEAIDLLNQPDKRISILAGGTDLCNMLKNGFRVPDLMIDIKGLSELNVIKETGNEIFIGSLVTYTDLINSELVKQKLYILWEAAHLVASGGVRNRATMVGNICSAVACMDSASPLLVHSAFVHVKSKDGERKIAINDWFVDNKKTDCKNNEIVTGVTLQIPTQKYATVYQKQMRYSGEDLSQSNVGIMAMEDKTYRIAFGSVGPTPKRSLKIEHFLNGKELTDSVIAEARQMIETVIAPISDVRSSKEYRMQMTKVMFERGLRIAIERLKNLK